MYVLLGIGTGGRPALGLAAAQESQTEIEAALRGANEVTVLAAFSEGEIGALPVILRLCREMRIHSSVLGIMPLPEEGEVIQEQAKALLAFLELAADSVQVVELGGGKPDWMRLRDASWEKRFKALYRKGARVAARLVGPGQDAG